MPHTPEPWKVERNSSYGVFHSEVYSADGMLIASFAWTRTPGQAEENVRLFTAAPALLAALAALVPKLENDTAYITVEEIEAAATAVRKATQP